MKSKKLFAILTLVAFMMTLVPMAAFGAAYSQAASFVTVDKTSVKADGTTKSTISIVFRNSAGAVMATTAIDDFYIKSSRDAEKVVIVDNVGSETVDPLTGIKTVTGKTANADGIIKLQVTSAVAGTATISVWKDSAAEDNKIGEATITFTASAAEIDSVGNVATYVNDAADADASAGESVKLKAKVVDSNSNGISGQTVTFKKSVNGSTYESVGTATTDALGFASLTIAETKAGSYNFKAYAGDKESAAAAFTYNALSPMTIDVASTTNYFDDATAPYVSFALKDIYGNYVTTLAALDAVVTAIPEDATETKNDEAAVFNIAADPDDSNYVRATFKAVASKKGEYTIKGSIAGSGINVTTKVNVAKFGTAQSMALKFTDKSVKSLKNNGEFKDLKVVLVDENGIEKLDTANAYITSGDTTLATMTDADTVTAVTDTKKFGKVVLTATHKTKALVATLEVPVVGTAAAFTVTTTVNDKVADVTIQTVDTQGNPTNFGADTTVNFVKPAAVTVEDLKVIDDVSGKSTAKLKVTEYGKYNLTAIAGGIAKTFEVEYVAPAAPKVVIGAKAVTLFIGAKGFVQDGAAKVADVAPFLKDSRTFVEVRALATAFGAEVAWDAATNTATLTRSDMTITIVIGGAVTKTVGGVATPVTTDVPAFITAEGRTVLPFRAIGEAFGATVSYDAASQAVSFVQ